METYGKWTNCSLQRFLGKYRDVHDSHRAQCKSLFDNKQILGPQMHIGDSHHIPYTTAKNGVEGEREIVMGLL